ncbi:unnamed protein product [Adineta steineri]|uniref:Uncharacterized protein n=1 Tax=Adineta steineri TaxID=433720 RepID=A0A813XSV8_9BILA|nr:unnamed protein product [Adineta steineri]
MSTITYPDIIHKKEVPEKFNPNSYRIISEKIPEHENIPFWYGNSHPAPLYTEPNPTQLPAQVSEPRNNPHAARKVDMVYTNASSFNAPFGIIKTDNVKNEEGNWWDWSPPKSETYGPRVKTQDEWKKIQESSYRNAFTTAGEMGSYATKKTRYSSNPLHIRTVGVVPITDLKPENLQKINQQLVEGISYEQQYNSRSDTNYPVRGRRHGAFIIKEQKSEVKPTQQSHFISSGKKEPTSSMWDLLHPKEHVRGQIPQNPYKYRRPLPRIEQAQDYGQAWQSAPYANDYQFDCPISQPPVVKQISFD